MAKYVIDSETLTGLADALRKVTGETRSYTPVEMIDAVTHIMETGTFILVDEDGNEIPAVFVDNETVFTATKNDIRLGKTAVTESGVTEGTKEIPAYHTTEGSRLVTNGSKLIIPIPDYDYTKMQAIVCSYNTSLTNSVAANKVAINGKVYPVQSTTAEASVTIDDTNERIDLGLTNNTEGSLVIKYFSYKEIY